jgi:hypothetical protein
MPLGYNLSRVGKCIHIYHWMKNNRVKCPPEIWIRIMVIMSQMKEEKLIFYLSFNGY